MPHSTRIGTDLIPVSQIAESLEKFGTAYQQRLYTSAEIAYCEAGGEERTQRYAARFAAKEACIKVLRPTADSPLDWRWIEIVKTPGGWCEIALHAGARQLADAAGITHLSVSLSHERDTAIAVVAATVQD